MKKFTLPLTTAISAAILASTACSSGREWQTDGEWQTDHNTRVCTDSANKRVPDRRCTEIGGYSPYRWYYISHGGYVPYYGSPVGGGSHYFPASSADSYGPAPSTAPAGAITRGGFGGNGAASESHAGGGAGGGEGAGE